MRVKEAIPSWLSQMPRNLWRSGRPEKSKVTGVGLTGNCRKSKAATT